MSPIKWGPESFTICTTKFFTAHRSIQIWEGDLVETETFLASYDRLGKGMNSTFSYLDLVVPPTDPTITPELLDVFNARVQEYVTETGAGDRLWGPIPIPGEIPGDGIGSLLPDRHVPMSIVVDDPLYNIVDNNCVTEVSEVLNKIRERFGREGITGVPEFYPVVELEAEWVLEPEPPTDVPPELQPDVDLLRSLLWDEPDPAVKQQRLEMYLAAVDDEGYMTFWSNYSLDDEIEFALPRWATWSRNLEVT